MYDDELEKDHKLCHREVYNTRGTDGKSFYVYLPAVEYTTLLNWRMKWNMIISHCKTELHSFNILFFDLGSLRIGGYSYRPLPWFLW